jgi:hypothetical protein
MSEYFSTEYQLDQEEIARRAYELYEARGCEDSRDLEDWFVASQQLIEERLSNGTAESSSETAQEPLSV